MAFCYRENALQQYYSLDQRIKKTVNGQSTLFFYDPQGHLLGEYAANGDLIQEVVWFGDLPVAAIRPNAQSGVDVFYIHADHLGTPRKISRASDHQVVWTWESEAFGATPPNQNPTGQGAFNFNLRFPGQYFDQETGLHYNYFRDYDAGTGRYVQSDPIGLQGGINTYGYVGGNPVNAADPLGLFLINPITVGAIEGLVNTAGGLIILNAANDVANNTNDPIPDPTAQPQSATTPGIDENCPPSKNECIEIQQEITRKADSPIGNPP